MIKYETKVITEEQEVPVSLICDRCKKEISIEDDMELQEWHHIDFVGGYSSVFGDGVIVQANICQDCLLELIGNFCRMSEDYEDN